MKKYIQILFGVMLGCVFLTMLIPPAKATENKEPDCLYVYSVAERIMRDRQDGVSLPEMITSVSGDAGRTALVKEAFSTYQIMNLSENKDASVKKFSEWAYNQCDKNK